MSKTPTRRPRMSPDAYAGFLRLMLTPLSREPRPSKELEAYLRYLGEAERFEAASGADHGRAA